MHFTARALSQKEAPDHIQELKELSSPETMTISPAARQIHPEGVTVDWKGRCHGGARGEWSDFATEIKGTTVARTLGSK